MVGHATFRSPAGGYIRGNEVFDPLTNGRTVGKPSGREFVVRQGIRLRPPQQPSPTRLPTP